MINPILFDILLRQVKDGRIKIEDIKDSDYKQAVANRLEG